VQSANQNQEQKKRFIVVGYLFVGASMNNNQNNIIDFCLQATQS